MTNGRSLREGEFGPGPDLEDLGAHDGEIRIHRDQQLDADQVAREIDTSRVAKPVAWAIMPLISRSLSRIGQQQIPFWGVH
jgi:hypothetical protein